MGNRKGSMKRNQEAKRGALFVGNRKGSMKRNQEAKKEERYLWEIEKTV